MTSPLTPRLIVTDAAKALQFYAAAMGAKELERYQTPDGRIVHAAFELPNGAVVALAEEDARYCNVAASSLEASPVMLNCMVEDPDGTAAAMAEHGAEILIPIDDRFYGHREGRVRDPFGHLWIIGKVTEELSPEEIERRLAGS